MASADQISGSVNIQKIQDDVVKPWNVVKSQPEISEEQKHRIKALYDDLVRSLRKAPGNRPRPCVHRSRHSSFQFLRPQISVITSVSTDKTPVLHDISTSGTTFKDKNALTMGVGQGSIRVEILKCLLSGGHHYFPP
jgi:fatty acid synthase subunit alpha, fungi type